MPKFSSSQKSKIFSAITLVIITILAIIFNLNPEPEPVEDKQSYDGLFEVVDVVDGDTVKLKIDDEITTVRLIGIDTPETVHPQKDVECFGEEATNQMKKLIEGKRVFIELDVTQDTYDRYGRLLVYLFTETEVLSVNEYMIENGFAHEYTYDTPYTKQQKYQILEKRAQEKQLGLWGDVCN